MVDIIMTDREKTIISKATAMLRLRYGKKASPENIHKYLINHPHPLVRQITDKVNEGANYIKDEIKSGGTWWQRDNIIRLSELGLWCLIRHRFYRKIFENLAPSIFAENTKIPLTDKPFNVIDTKIMRYLLQYSYKQLKGQWTYDLVLEEMTRDTNPAITNILNKLVYSLKKTVSNKYECAILYDFAATGLWFAQHDTAYRDVFFWILYEIGNDEIKEVVKPFYLPPEKWYINIWHDHRIRTAELKAEGELGVYGHDLVEEMSIPEMRNKQLEDIIKGGKKKNG